MPFTIIEFKRSSVVTSIIPPGGLVAATPATVAPPKIARHGNTEEHRKRVRIAVPLLPHRLADLVKKPAQVLSRAHGADGTGKDVIDN